MATALNNFKTTLKNPIPATTYDTYTPPTGYATVILMAQVSNNGASTIQITAGVKRSGVSTILIKEADIPANDAINVLTARLILETGDTLQFKCSNGTDAQLVLSYLETLITGQ